MVEIGDVIKLRPSIFEEEYKSSQYYWSDKYLYEDHFSHVSLWFKKLKQPGDMARTIFGSCESRVIYIDYVDESPFEVISDHFRMIFPLAMEKNEIKVEKFDDLKFIKLNSLTTLVEDLEFFEMEYLKGTYSVMERENNKLAFYKQGFHLMKHEKYSQDL